MFINGSDNNSYANYKLEQADNPNIDNEVIVPVAQEVYSKQNAEIHQIPEVNETFQLPTQNQESHENSSPLQVLLSLDSSAQEDVLNKIQSIPVEAQDAIAEEMRDLRRENSGVTSEEKGEKFLEILEDTFKSYGANSPENTNENSGEVLAKQMDLKSAVNNETYDFFSKSMGIDIYA